MATWGPELAASFGRFAERIHLFDQEGPGYFGHPLALPVIQLPVWAAQAARRRGARIADAAVMDAVEAAALGYLHVRLQDDLLDEGVGEPAEVSLLATALLLRHEALLRRSAGTRQAFWERYAAVWAGYAEAMLFERALFQREGVTTEAQFLRVLDRSQPLELPPAAILAGAGRCAAPGWSEALPRLVRDLARAHQLFMDLVDVFKDQRNGNRTLVLNRLERAGAGSLAAALLGPQGLDAVVAEAGEALDAAEQEARALDWPALIGFIAARRAAMRSAQDDFFRAFFAQIIS